MISLYSIAESAPNFSNVSTNVTENKDPERNTK